MFLILKIFHYSGLQWWVQLFPRYKDWYKKWYLHFHTTYDHQVWQTGTSRGADSYETNRAGAVDVIKSRSWDKLKTYLFYQCAYWHQIWQDGNLKLVPVIFYQIFIFSPNDAPSKTMKKCILFNLKSSFHSWDFQIFVIFSLPFHTFLIQKDKWKWNNLYHELAGINLQM